MKSGTALPDGTKGAHASPRWPTRRDSTPPELPPRRRLPDRRPRLQTARRATAAPRMPVGLAVHALTTREHFGATWSRAAVCSSAWQLKRRDDLLFETRARYSRGCGSKTSFGGEPGRAGRARARTPVAVREDQCGHDDEPVHAIDGATQLFEAGRAPWSSGPSLRHARGSARVLAAAANARDDQTSRLYGT